MAMTPPITPPATATVDWTALLFGLGTGLTCVFVDVVSVDSAATLFVDDGRAVPMVLKIPAAASPLPIKAVGEVDTSAAAGVALCELTGESEGKAITVSSA